MADTVRYLMERMIPELEDLEQKGYFSREEIRNIVKKRQHFEYLLKRRAAVKTDYLRYIEYETALEELRKVRKQARSIRGKDGPAEHGGVRRVHFIYERALRKFRGDLRLWVRWLHFCRASGASQQTSKVVTRALQLHPKAPGLWSWAAAWEFEANANPNAARVLMQRGLRMCPGAQQLWAEYLRMELLYVARLRVRRRVLGIDGLSPGDGEQADVVAPDPESGGDAADDVTNGTAKPTAPEAAVEAVLRGGVAKVVIQNALAAAPGSVSFRQKLLDILEPFTFPGIEALEQQVYDSIAADCASEQAWDLRARRWLRPRPPAAVQGSGVPQALAEYERALAALPTASMHDLYAAFLQEQLVHALAGEGQAPADLQPAALAERLLALCRRAAEADAASEQLLLSWPALALRCGRVDEAAEAARMACQAAPACAGLWHQRLALQAQSAVQLEDAERAVASLEDVVLAAVAAVPGQAGAPLWLAGLEALAALRAPPARLLSALEAALLCQRAGPLQGGLGSVAAAAVKAISATQGLQAARTFYRRLLRLPPPGGDFFHAVVDLELAQPSLEQAHALEAVFEAGVAAYGSQDAQLWLKYAAFERRMARTGEGRGQGTVYWRAMKSLADVDAFVAGCQQTGGVKPA